MKNSFLKIILFFFVIMSLGITESLGDDDDSIIITATTPGGSEVEINSSGTTRQRLILNATPSSSLEVNQSEENSTDPSQKMGYGTRIKMWWEDVTDKYDKVVDKVKEYTVATKQYLSDGWQAAKDGFESIKSIIS